MSEQNLKGFADLSDYTEDKRIKLIIAAVRKMRPGQVAAVCVDNVPGKPERYRAKLLAACPEIKIIDQLDGPTADIVTIRVGPPDPIPEPGKVPN